MQIELKLKEILGESESTERKVEEILKLMNWNKKKLTEAILKHGNYSDKQRGFIIKEFWGRPKA